MLDAFNALAPDAAEERLLAVCAAARWAREVTAARPYRSREDLLTAADAALARLDWPELLAAISAHPRLGRPPAGDDRAAQWSRREQASVIGATGPGESPTGEADPGATNLASTNLASTNLAAAELAAVNLAYEERFGHILLVCANGRSAAQIVAAGRERLGNDDDTERGVVRGELSSIVRLRLTRLVDEPTEPAKQTEPTEPTEPAKQTEPAEPAKQTA